MICQVSSTSDGRTGIIVKYVILLFPESAEELNNAPEAQLPGWPGIKAYEGTFGVVLKPTVPWQCPVLPFIRPGVPFAELSMATTSDKIRWAVAAIMRKCGQPLILNDGRAMLAKWQQIRAKPRLADTHQLHEVAGLISHLFEFLQFTNRHISVLKPYQ
jgi:hypothetical protein